MKKIICFILVLVICTGLFSCMPNLKKYVVKYGSEKVTLDDSYVESAEYLSLLLKLNSFSIGLTDSISNSNAGSSNYGISPVAVYMSLATACEMASGETREEILNALGMTYDEVKEYSKFVYALCNKEYTYTDTYGMEHVSAHEELASSLWISSEHIHKTECVHSLATNFNCDVFSIDYKKGTAEKLINQYIEYKTHSVIKKGVSISKNATLSLISVYHLKEIWNEFGKNLTQSLESYRFVNASGDAVDKQLLKSTYAGGKVYTTPSFTSFYIETEHGYRLYFMTPKNNLPLNTVFNSSNIAKMIENRDYGFIDDRNERINYTRILFPQFSIEFKGDVSQNLKEDFKIEALFDKENCNLSNIVHEDAYLDKLIHVAKINVDAKGIEGASINLAQSNKTPIALPNYEKVYHEFVITEAFGIVLVDANGMILYTGEVNSLK